MEEGEQQKTATAYDKDTSEANAISPVQGAAVKIRRGAENAPKVSRDRGIKLQCPPTDYAAIDSDIMRFELSVN